MAMTRAASTGALHADLAPLAHQTDLANKIMKKRQDEIARRQNLLNPKNRMGASHKALDEQVARKQAEARAEMDERRYHDSGQLLQDEVLAVVEQEKQELARARQREVVEYNLTNLRREQRREFHLSDPRQLKNDAPPNYAELGPSSFVTFPSSDIDPVKAKKEQQSATKAYLLHQIAEKEARVQAERDIERKHYEDELKSNQVRQHIQYLEEMEAKQEKIDEAADNKEIAEAHYQRRQQKLQREIDRTASHADFIMNDPRMTEETHWEMSPWNPGKLISYKRPSPDEMQDCLTMNANIMLNKVNGKDAELAEEVEEARRVRTQMSVQSALEDRKQHALQAQRNAMVEHNKRLAQEKKAKDVLERQAHKSFDIVP